MRRSKKFLLPVLVVTALAAVGAASTNAISFTSGSATYQDVGYGQVTTNTAIAIDNVHYVSDASGANIEEVDITFHVALPEADTVSIAFNGGTKTTCTDSGDETTYDCTGGTNLVAGSGLAESATTITDLDVSVLPAT